MNQPTVCVAHSNLEHRLEVDSQTFTWDLLPQGLMLGRIGERFVSGSEKQGKLAQSVYEGSPTRCIWHVCQVFFCWLQTHHSALSEPFVVFTAGAQWMVDEVRSTKWRQLYSDNCEQYNDRSDGKPRAQAWHWHCCRCGTHNSYTVQHVHTL